MKCQNCGKTAMFGIGPQESVPVCLECFIMFVQAQDRILGNLERQANYLAGQIEMTAGMPGLVPRYPPRQHTVLAGNVTLNNIRVTDSNIGVLNTGSIGAIDGAVGVMRNAGAADAAEAFKALTEAVAAASDITYNEKNKVLELLSIVASEGAAPKDKRRGHAMKSILDNLITLLTGSAALAELWERLGPTIQQLF